MFNSISWNQFITAFIIALAIYYFVVILLYYRQDLRFAFLKKEKRNIHETSGNANGLSAVTDLKEIIQEILQQAAVNCWIKEELLMALYSRLQDYPELQSPALRVAISNHISKQAEAICGIRLDDDELKTIW